MAGDRGTGCKRRKRRISFYLQYAIVPLMPAPAPHTLRPLQVGLPRAPSNEPSQGSHRRSSSWDGMGRAFTPPATRQPLSRSPSPSVRRGGHHAAAKMLARTCQDPHHSQHGHHHASSEPLRYPGRVRPGPARPSVLLRYTLVVSPLQLQSCQQPNFSL